MIKIAPVLPLLAFFSQTKQPNRLQRNAEAWSPRVRSDYFTPRGLLKPKLKVAAFTKASRLLPGVPRFCGLGFRAVPGLQLRLLVAGLLI